MIAMKEVWKPIKHYEGIYEVSNLGRVKRLDCEVMQYNPQLDKKIPVKYPVKYLKFEDARGYSRVTLSKDNVQERFQVHRLVAEAFIPNPENKPCVNHKDFQRKNNRVTNLEWVTHLENEHHKLNQTKPKFIAVSPEGEISEWSIVLECCRQLGFNRSGVERCLKGIQESHRGYTFKYISPLEK